MNTISQSIRNAINNSGYTSRSIEMANFLSMGTVQKFVTGERGLSLEAAEALALYFNLELVSKK